MTQDIFLSSIPTTPTTESKEYLKTFLSLIFRRRKTKKDMIMRHKL